MPRVEELFAWVIADTGPDDEGIPAFTPPAMPNTLMPLMGADRARADSFREAAQMFANIKGKPIKLIRSTGIEVVEEIQPNA